MLPAYYYAAALNQQRAASMISNNNMQQAATQVNRSGPSISGTIGPIFGLGQPEAALMISIACVVVCLIFLAAALYWESSQ